MGRRPTAPSWRCLSCVRSSRTWSSVVSTVVDAGTNVGYSGTVGGALVAATFNIPAMAISSNFHRKWISAARPRLPVHWLSNITWSTGRTGLF